tara:strand:- start:137 stop:442 length:306 start_codon:yes stop_codon:yes gene_type:complete
MITLIPWVLGGIGTGLLLFSKPEGLYDPGANTTISKTAKDVGEMTSDSITYFFKGIDTKVWVGLFIWWYVSDLKGKEVRPAVKRSYKKKKSQFKKFKKRWS